MRQTAASTKEPELVTRSSGNRLTRPIALASRTRLGRNAGPNAEANRLELETREIARPRPPGNLACPLVRPGPPAGKAAIEGRSAMGFRNVMLLGCVALLACQLLVQGQQASQTEDDEKTLRQAG